MALPPMTSGSFAIVVQAGSAQCDSSSMAVPSASRFALAAIQ
jgi:hypothetical protein